MKHRNFFCDTYLSRFLKYNILVAYKQIRLQHVMAMKSPRTVSVISVPLNLGQPKLGPDLTPTALHDKGLLDLLYRCDWRVDQVSTDFLSCKLKNSVLNNRINFKGNAKNCHEVGEICHQVEKQVSLEINKGNFVLLLGGDHCIPIGSVPAVFQARPKTGVIWVDAHADINTPESSLSGNMHGMPLSFLLGLVDELKDFPGFHWFKPCMTPEDIVYIGLRDLDPYEKRVIKKLGIRAYTMYEVDKYGIGRVMDEVNEYFINRNLHLSFDIDAVDPFFAPHTGTAVRGGLTFREANFICESLAETGRLTSMELVEVNPSIHTHQPAEVTIEMALTLIGSAIGDRILPP